MIVSPTFPPCLPNFTPLFISPPGQRLNPPIPRPIRPPNINLPPGRIHIDETFRSRSLDELALDFSLLERLKQSAYHTLGDLHGIPYVSLSRNQLFGLFGTCQIHVSVEEFQGREVSPQARLAALDEKNLLTDKQSASLSQPAKRARRKTCK